MPIPDYQMLMLPFLKMAGDAKVHTMREAVTSLAAQFGLSDDERKELLPSGKQEVFDNRVGWAKTFLKKALLVQSVQRGQFQITERGAKVLAEKPERIDVAYLRQFLEFREFDRPAIAKNAVGPKALEITGMESPDDLMATAYLDRRGQVEQEVLLKVKSSTPEFFERLVVKLIAAMGYGGSLADAGKAIGKSSDGGVDGVIKEDMLGLDEIYIQAKRWDSASVGRPEIQKFVGALHGKRSRKGIFITTSVFTKDAYEYAKGLETKVILIDGPQLAKFMFDYEIGISVESTYEIKRIDGDFFEDGDPDTA